MEEEHSELRGAQEGLRRAEAAHAAELGGLRAKLRWYVENQQLIDELEARCCASQARVLQLDRCLTAAGITPPRPPAADADADGGAATNDGADGDAPDPTDAAAAAAVSSTREHERLQMLEAEVGTLQALLAKRGRGVGSKGRPSVGELVAAAGPSPEQVARHAALQLRVDALEAQGAAAEAGTQRKVRTLRQQHERVVAAHEARAAALEAQLKVAQPDKGAAGGPNGGGARARVRELERQVKEVRETLGKKVRDLEADKLQQQQQQ